MSLNTVYTLHTKNGKVLIVYYHNMFAHPRYVESQLLLLLKAREHMRPHLVFFKNITAGFSLSKITVQAAIAKTPQLLEFAACFCMGAISMTGSSENKNIFVIASLATLSTSSYKES